VSLTPLLSLRFTRKQLYEVVADMNHYPQFVPYCRSVSIEKPPNRPFGDNTTVEEATMTVGFLGFTESYTSRVTCRPHEFVEVRCKPLLSAPSSLTTSDRPSRSRALLSSNLWQPPGNSMKQPRSLPTQPQVGCRRCSGLRENRHLPIRRRLTSITLSSRSILSTRSRIQFTQQSHAHFLDKSLR
jgi:hypothetical protein